MAEDRPTEELNHLLEGYRRFREKGWHPQRARWDRLREGQQPKVLVIACSDSRVDPAQIFDVDPGEIFVVRNVAALVPPFETTPGHHGVSAALEERGKLTLRGAFFAISDGILHLLDEHSGRFNPA